MKFPCFRATSADYLWITGSDHMPFLQGQVTTNVHSLGMGEASDCWILNPNGRIIAYLRIFRREDGILIQAPLNKGPDLRAHLDRYVVMSDVTITPWERRTLSVQGLTQEPQWPENLIALPHNRCSQMGFDLIFENDDIPTVRDYLSQANIEEADKHFWDQERIRAFIPLFGKDMLPDENPLVYGLERGISSNKGCYVGQETVAKTRDRGRPPKLLVQLAGKKTPTKPGVLLNLDRKEVGQTTSFIDVDHESIIIATVKYNDAIAAQPLEDAFGQSWTIRNVVKYKD